MRQITIAHESARQLGSLTEQTVLCDARGRALGFFSPLQPAVPVEQLQLEPPLSIAETEELRKVRAGKPLNEILARLGIR